LVDSWRLDHHHVEGIDLMPDMRTCLSKITAATALAGVSIIGIASSAYADTNSVRAGAEPYRLYSSLYTVSAPLGNREVSAACGSGFHVEYGGKDDWESGARPIIRIAERDARWITAVPYYAFTGKIQVDPETISAFKVSLHNGSLITAHTISFSWLCIPNAE
jgi:hypothetical protein